VNAERRQDNQVLVVGLPRSGSTWVARALAQGIGARYLEEPDNHFRFGFALRAKVMLGRGQYPTLESWDTAEKARAYETLWRCSFGGADRRRRVRIRRALADQLVSTVGVPRVSASLEGAPPGPVLATAMRLALPRTAEAGRGPLVVKSVYAALAVDWIASHFNVGVIVTVRDPLNILSSWIELGWVGGSDPEPVAALNSAQRRALSDRYGPLPQDATSVGRAAWLIGVLALALEEAVARNPSWRRVEHEALCRSPSEGFRRLAYDLGHQWTEAGDLAIHQWNRSGGGYETRRLASELPAAWQSRLSADTVREARVVLDGLSRSDR
jgi:hypothetical protein